MKFKSENYIKSTDTQIVSFIWNGKPCEWWATSTGKRMGDDNHMQHEVKFMLYVGTKAIVEETRYISEYSDNKIEFQNTCRNICGEDFGDVIEKMSY